MGHETSICEDGKAALAAIEKKNTFDVAIVDLAHAGDFGLGRRRPSPHGFFSETEIIISTGHGNMEDAIQAPPPRCVRLPDQTYQAGGHRQRARTRGPTSGRSSIKRSPFESRLKAVEGSPDIVGGPLRWNASRSSLIASRPPDSNVLILGETGTGKDLSHGEFHQLSRRSPDAICGRQLRRAA